MTVLEGKFEITSLTETLSLHGSHLQVSIADENRQVTGGQLKEGSLINTPAEIIIGVLPGFEFGREWDDATGFEELKIDSGGK